MSEKKYLVVDCETTGLRSFESKITCICAKDNEDNWFMEAGSDEKEILEKFFLFVSGYDNLVSANGKDFDIPFILIRAYINNIPHHFAIDLIWKKHFDIINDITSYRISLDNLARLFCFDTKTGNGLKAIQLYNEAKYSELVDYCKNDVVLTEKVFLKWRELKNGNQGI